MADSNEYIIGDETSTSSSRQLGEIQSQVTRKESSPLRIDMSIESLPSNSMSIKDCPDSAEKPSTSFVINATSEKNELCAKIVLECPICLQSCIHPAQLPCGHVFCFLCIKGVAYKNRRCAMCRQEIPTEFLDHPQLVNGLKDIVATKTTEDGYQWFYEGRNGWWQYDDRTSQDIEDAYKNGDKSCTILVAGYVYIVDLDALLQQRQNEPTRCRRVKRDLATIIKKGVAGLRINDDTLMIDAQITSNNAPQSINLFSRTLSNYNSQLDIDDRNEHVVDILSPQSSVHMTTNTIDSTAVIQPNEVLPVRTANALLDVTNADHVSFSNDILILHPNNEISNIGDTLLNTNENGILNTDFQSMLNVTLNDLNMLSIGNNILYLGTLNNHDTNTHDEQRNGHAHY